MSTIEMCTGNMFEEEFCEAFAHGCNEKGVARAGIAGEIRARYPLAISKYEIACQRGLFGVGKVQIVKCPDPTFKNRESRGNRWIVNMGTQDNPGKYAKLSWILECVNKLIANEDKLPFSSIALPKIGCGIGGLDWQEVKPELSKAFKKSKMIVRFYE